MIHLEEDNQSPRTTEVKTKSYLVSPLNDPRFINMSMEEFKEEKNKALKELETDLKATNGDIDKIYQIFLEVKATKAGMLRYRREYILSHAYKDTTSYLHAIYLVLNAIHSYNFYNMTIEQRASITSAKLQSYHQFEKVREMQQEAQRCAFYHIDEYTQFIARFKKGAIRVFKAEIEQQTTIAGLLHYYALAKRPGNILRIYTGNWFSGEGDTNSYKEAIFTITKKAMTLEQFDSVKNTLVLMQLCDELEVIRPYFNMEWKNLVDDFRNYIQIQMKNSNFSNVMESINNNARTPQ